MTREEALKSLDGVLQGYLLKDDINQIFNEHEAQLKAKDEEIENARGVIEWHEKECKNYIKLHHQKARSIVAKLGKNWKRSRQFLGKNDEVTVSDQVAFMDAITILKHKG